MPYFRRALRLDYGQTDWRMRLATTLEALGRKDEAVQAAIAAGANEARQLQAIIAALRTELETVCNVEGLHSKFHLLLFADLKLVALAVIKVEICDALGDIHGAHFSSGVAQAKLGKTHECVRRQTHRAAIFKFHFGQRTVGSL